MSAATGAVDFRRFRTWDAEPAMVATPAWRILVRYGYIRLTSSWMGRILLILLAIAAVLTVGATSYALAGGSGIPAMAWLGSMMQFSLPLAAILLLVAGPLFAEDIRFNAPLFYFSKPLTTADYLRGKLAFLGSLVGLAVVVPILLLLVLSLVVGLPASHAPDAAEAQMRGYRTPAEIAEYRADWQSSHIDTLPEWFGATAATLPGLLLVVGMFTAIAVACSAYTRRGWHASMAFVAIVGGTAIAGATFADSVEGAAGHLASPVGWTSLILSMPLTLMFPSQAGGLNDYQKQQVEGAATAIPVAYVLTLATTLACLWLARRRLLAQEARL